MVISNKDTQSAGRGRPPAAQAEDCSFPLREGERWLVAQTLRRREKLGRLHLGAQSFRNFFPRFHKTVRHARKLREVIAPVFPGYIFVVLDPERHRWRSINGTFGLARLISAHRRPTPVPTGVVEALLASVDELGLVRFRRRSQTGTARARDRRSLRAAFGRATAARPERPRSSFVLANIMGGHAPVMMDRANLTAA
jgi:transcriptional antiterminator RfaH